MPLDDREIMLQVQNGQFELFEELVSRYRLPLLRVAASKLGNVAWAEDVVQETFLAVFAARETYNPTFSFRTWLWTILLNLCRRQWKRRTGRPNELSHSTGEALAGLPFWEPVHHETGLSQALLAEQRERLHQTLNEIPDVQADALRLRFFGGLKFDEIAKTMGCSLSGAKLRVRNGLLALSNALREEEGDER